MDKDRYQLMLGTILFLIFLFIVFVCNSCVQEKWNDGVCPNCNVNYNLIGVNGGINHYICPNCHEEVTRYLL